MLPDNKKNQPSLLLGLTILFLLLLSQIPADIDLGIIKTKKVDILIDIKSDSLNSSMFNLNREVNSASIINDALLELFSFPAPTTIESLSGNTAQMKYFYDALKSSKDKNIRVAHYGDSAIEGDMITSDLRLNFQKTFGGYGAGFLSITSKDTRFRASTRQTFSGDWETYSITESSNFPFPPGISGTVSLPAAGSWVKYEVSGIGNAPKYFNTVRVFYSGAVKSSVTYKFDDGKELKADLEQGNGIKELILNAGGNARSVLITAPVSKQARFYGVSLESGSGIYVDNFPLRGNSGLSLENVTTEVLSGFNHLLNYKLIVLNFGLNLVSETSDYTRYEKQMVKVISNLKKALPETSFLLISVGDKSIKKGSRFATDPNVPKLVEIQKRIAETSGCAFWNLYQAMGGENSMNNWVTASPPLAYKDYTHVNNDGAKKIADLLAETILDAYRKNR